MLKFFLFFTFLVSVIGASTVHSQTLCSATVLSPKEAQELVMAIPLAEIAKNAGGKVLTTDWDPGPSYRKDIFYFYFVGTTGKGRQTTLLDNGVIGYFAVNRITGRVVEGLPPKFETIEGKVLAEMQARIRAKHCIDRMTNQGRAKPEVRSLR